MDDSLLVNTMLDGRFADIDDIIACSPDGTFATLTADGEVMSLLESVVHRAGWPLVHGQKYR